MLADVADQDGAWTDEQSAMAFDLLATPKASREGRKPGTTLDFEGRPIAGATDPAAVARREIAAQMERREVVAELDEVDRALASSEVAEDEAAPDEDEEEVDPDRSEGDGPAVLPSRVEKRLRKPEARRDSRRRKGERQRA